MNPVIMENQVSQVQSVNPETPALLETRDLMDAPAILDPKALLVKLDSQGQMVFPEALASLGYQAKMEIRVTKVPEDQKATLVSKDLKELPDIPDLKAIRDDVEITAQLVPLVIEEIKAIPALMVKLDPLEWLVTRAAQDHVGHPDKPDLMETRDHKDLRVNMAQAVLLVTQALKDQMERTDPKASQAILDALVSQVISATLVNPVLLASPVDLELMARAEPMVIRVIRDLKVLPASQDLTVLKDLRDTPELRAQPDLRDTAVLMAIREREDKMVSQATQVNKVQLEEPVPRGRTVIQVLLVQPEIKEMLDSQEIRANLVTKDHKVWMVQLARPVKTVMQDSKVYPVKLVTKVLSDLLATRVQMASTVLQVLLVTRVIMVQPAIKDP